LREHGLNLFRFNTLAGAVRTPAAVTNVGVTNAEFPATTPAATESKGILAVVGLERFKPR
jgi:hypothetical protein